MSLSLVKISNNLLLLIGGITILIAGISGSSKYNNGACQYTDREMKHRLKKFSLCLLVLNLKPELN